MSEAQRQRIEASTKRLGQILAQYPASEQIALVVGAFGASATAVAVAANTAGSAGRVVLQALEEEIESFTRTVPQPVLAAWLEHVAASLPADED